MYIMAMIKCSEEWRDEVRQQELERSRKVIASLISSLRVSMVSAFAATLGHDIDPIYEQAAEEELDAADSKKTIEEYDECLKDSDRLLNTYEP
jgi:hypothetical protein